MSFNLEVVNTGVSANDGLGDPLRTAFSKSHNNDVTLSGQLGVTGFQIISGLGDISLTGLKNQFNNLSGNLQLEYESGDNATGQSLLSTIDSTGQYITNNFVSGYVQNFVFDMPESGQSVVVSGLKQGPIDYDESWYGGANNDSLYRGRYTLTLTERHMYYHTTSDSPKEDWVTSGAWQLDTVNMNIYGLTSQNADAYIFEFPVTNVGNAFEGGNHEYTIRLTGDSNSTHDPRWVITRDSIHTYAPLTGHGVFSVGGESDHKRRHELIVNLVEY